MRGRTRRPQRRKEPRVATFRCASCRMDVSMHAPGTAHRNHCPSCLGSLHLDRRVPGDRDAGCGGRMEALGVTVRDDGEWLLIHECRRCGVLSANRIAGDDNALALLRLAMRPLSGSRLTI
ncbi:RNHCP domain-containing protein [Nonomuraea endophytica]|uniref:RNHCP domain-containing protein n=1 Tax=Nonomuraea endophytica TaxID=714136 RepID=UPI00161DBCF9|nr:RNHCP domain-containing protein [Nonomuraea endophytica]